MDVYIQTPEREPFSRQIDHILMAYILARARARDCLRVVMEIQSRKYIDGWMDGLLAWIKYSKMTGKRSWLVSVMAVAHSVKL